jgi:hypothetical protein
MTVDASVEAQRGPRRRRVAGIVLTVLLGMQVLFVAYGLAKANSQEPLTNPRFAQLPVPANSLPMTLEAGAPLAQQYASQWRSDARIVAASERLDWSDTDSSVTATELPPDGALIYIFVSGDETLNLYLDRGSGNYSGTFVTGEGGSVWTPLDLSLYQKSSTIAGLSADLLAGQEYRDACPDQRHTSTITAGKATAADGTSVPAWIVTYDDDTRGDDVDVVVTVNAVSGDVLQTKNEAPDCDSK